MGIHHISYVYFEGLVKFKWIDVIFGGSHLVSLSYVQVSLKNLHIGCIYTFFFIGIGLYLDKQTAMYYFEGMNNE